MLIEMTKEQISGTVAALRFMAKQADRFGDKERARMLRRYALDIEDQRAGEPSNYRFV